MAQIVSPPPGGKVDVLPALTNPQEFHGDPLVDHVVAFGPAFKGLVGTFADTQRWNPEVLVGQGVVVLEHHFDAARRLMDGVNRLAQRIIADESLYDDPVVAGEFFGMSREGFNMLRRHAPEFGMEGFDQMPIVALERGGLVASRHAVGVDKDAQLPQEQRVVTKRTHLKGEQPGDLSVTVTFRDFEAFKQATDLKEVGLPDFVNPASWASAAAAILAARARGVNFAGIHHRSISLTRQGTLVAKGVLRDSGIPSTFYAVGEADTLNEHYYLMGPRAVADAGHILRHFLPSWYQR